MLRRDRATKEDENVGKISRPYFDASKHPVFIPLVHSLQSLDNFLKLGRKTRKRKKHDDKNAKD
jgi:hypothetical protein